MRYPALAAAFKARPGWGALIYLSVRLMLGRGPMGRIGGGATTLKESVLLFAPAQVAFPE
jgi:hypothetical protein